MHVLNSNETLELLKNNPKSFCRYGDGEFQLMLGSSLGFQEYNKHLVERLKEILSSYDDKCYIGLPRSIFHSFINAKDAKDYYRLNAIKWRKMLMEIVCKEKTYINAEFTVGYPSRGKPKQNTQEKIDYFEKIKTLFEGRKLVIVSGSTVFNKIKYNVFEKAASRVHIFASSKNAWAQYNEILAKLKTIPKDYTICAILGPTATVLAYDLAQEGYTAWDIGHLAKLYDAFVKEETQEKNFQVQSFFAPD